MYLQRFRGTFAAETSIVMIFPSKKKNHNFSVKRITFIVRGGGEGREKTYYCIFEQDTKVEYTLVCKKIHSYRKNSQLNISSAEIETCIPFSIFEPIMSPF